MGVKGRATLAIIFIIVLLCSMWLHGSLDHQWEYCMKIYVQKNQTFRLYRVNGSEVDAMSPLPACPGQKFQVSDLLMHLRAAPVSTNDVLLEPYLSSWDELIDFLETMGPMVGLISREIEEKTSVIRELSLKDRAEQDDRTSPDGPEGGAYDSVRSMIEAELSRGLVDFEKTTVSGCRTLLRLHRALLWLQFFLSRLAEEPEGGRSPAELCREAYRLTLAQHHSWLVRRAAELAFISLPNRAFFNQLMCARTQAEATVVLDRVVWALKEVYNRTQQALEDYSMLELP